MIQKINGEQPFQILSDAFTVGPSQTGYDLQISANGTDYSTLFSVAANTTRLVNNVSNGAFFRLKNNVGEVDVNWRTTCKSGGSGGGSYVLPIASETTLGGIKVGDGLSIDGNGVLSSQGGGSIDSGAVLSLVNSAITDFSNDLQEGEPIVGMAKQLYSPDGVTSEGAFAYRTTAGDADVSSGPAELRKVEGNSIYPELQYNDSAVLERGGEEVEGFEASFYWGEDRGWVETEQNVVFSGANASAIKVSRTSKNGYYQFHFTNGVGDYSFDIYQSSSILNANTNTTKVSDNNFIGEYSGCTATIVADENYITATMTNMNGFEFSFFAYFAWGSSYPFEVSYYYDNTIPNDIPAGESTYTYDGTSEWITYVDTAQTATILPKMGRMKLSNYPYPCIYINNTTLKAVQFRWDNSTSSLTPNSNFITVVETNRSFTFSTDNVSGTVTYDGEWLTLTIESTDGYVRSFEYGLEYQIYTETSAWTPTLPQAISNMQIDGVDYVPEDGDEITINRVPYRDSRAIFPAPTNFVAVGLNSYCASANTPISITEKTYEEGTYEEDEIYVRAVPQTEYTIYSRIGLMPASVGYGVIVDAGTWKGQSGIYKNISIAPVPDAVKSAIEETGNNYNSTVFAHILSYRAEGEDDAYVDLILHPDRDGNIEVWDTNEETYLHLYTDDEENWFAINIDGVESYVGLKWDAANRIISFCGADTEYAEPEDCYAIDFTMTAPIYKIGMPDGDYDGNITGELYHITVPEGFTYIWMEQEFDAEEEEKEAQKAEIFGNLCVHPTWSGIKDEEYAEYTESKVPLQTLMIACPLWSIGSGETAHRNIIDLENGKLIRNITSEPYSAERVLWYLSHSYYIGGNFDFDSELIYVAQDPVITDVSIEDYKYEANDFSVEYLQKGNKVDDGKAVVDTYYMTNLVDKLRRMEGLVHVDSLSGTGAENTLYECNDRLFMWSDEGGAVAEWTDDLSVLGAEKGYGIAFSYIPNGQTIFEARYIYDSDSDYRVFKMSGDTLVMCNTGGTVLSACTVGESKEMRTRNNNDSYYWVKVKVEKNWIGFEIAANHYFRNIWDGKVSGGHYVMVDHTNYPYLAVTSDAGIARWNSKGQVIHKNSNYSTKNIYFNSNSSNRATFLTNGTNGGPSKMFVPTQGGTAGQMLVSAGDNAEPTWTNWIKSVQITSDDYEALATKDPNTLYLIVDE